MEKLLSLTEIAELIGVSRSTLYRMRRDDVSFPIPSRLSSGVSRWFPSDVRRYVRARQQQPASWLPAAAPAYDWGKARGPQRKKAA